MSSLTTHAQEYPQLLKANISLQLWRSGPNYVQTCVKLAGRPLGLLTNHSAQKIKRLFREFHAEPGLIEHTHHGVRMGLCL